MLFTTTDFLAFVACTFTFYYLLPTSGMQVGLLLASSLFFYAYASPSLLILLVASATINAIASHLLCVVEKKSLRRLLACVGVAANLGCLAFFKYSPLISETLFSPEGSIGAFLLTVPLPIGISFYTFQGISLLVDTFRDRESQNTAGASHLDKTGLFIVFFPQLIAGPIVKSRDFLPQIRLKYFRDIDWEGSTKRLVTGYFLKMVVADNLKDLTQGMQYPHFQTRPATDLFWMLFAYSMQIFADFAGYSLIAIGLAGLFGYKLHENFKFPYTAWSFSEFWRRWHISLSSFLKEYLYIPLGGNRHGSVRTYVNLFLVMLLGGLWHGAAWGYAAWGAYHGLALATERFIVNRFQFTGTDSLISHVMSRTFVFSFVSLGWLFFAIPDFSHVLLYIRCMVANQHPFAFQSMFPFLIIVYSSPVVIYHALDILRRSKWARTVMQLEPWLLGVMLFLILTNSGSSGDFVYFQF